MATVLIPNEQGQIVPKRMRIGFNKTTRPNKLMLQTMNYVRSGISEVPLPLNGYLAVVSGIITLLFTTAATGTYANSTTVTKIGGVTPFSIINRIQVNNNNSNSLWDTTLYGAHFFERTYKENYETLALLAGSRVETTAFFVIPASYTTSTQYTIRLPFKLYIALGQRLQAGLQLMQNNASKYSLKIFWGDIESNLLTLGGTTPSIVVNSCIVEGYVEYYNVPEDPIDRPNLAKSRIVLENIVDVVATGDNIYQVQTGPEYLTILREIVNNGAGISAASMNNIKETYSGNQTPLDISSEAWLYDQAIMLGGLQMPQGWYYHDYARESSGLLSVAGERDVANTRNITDFKHVFQIAAGTSLTTAFARNISEYMTRSNFVG